MIAIFKVQELQEIQGEVDTIILEDFNLYLWVQGRSNHSLRRM